MRIEAEVAKCKKEVAALARERTDINGSISTNQLVVKVTSVYI